MRYWKFGRRKTSDFLMHHGIDGQRWGVRHGPPYPLERKSTSIHRKAIKIEPDISNDIKRISDKNKVQLYGFDHRLKTKESIDRKTRLGKDIKDAVRYTFILPENAFVNKYNSIVKDLNDLGYSETKLKNYFKRYSEGLSNHKSLQGNYKTKDGYEFEIQYQTNKSQKAKDLKVPLYEEVRQPNVDPKRKSEIIKEMNKLADSVIDPVDIFTIKEH